MPHRRQQRPLGAVVPGVVVRKQKRNQVWAWQMPHSAPLKRSAMKSPPTRFASTLPGSSGCRSGPIIWGWRWRGIAEPVGSVSVMAYGQLRTHLKTRTHSRTDFVREYLDTLDDAVCGAASEGRPKFISKSDPAREDVGDLPTPGACLGSHIASGKRTMNPSRFGIRTFGRV
jgi:hypothetical protein